MTLVSPSLLPRYTDTLPVIMPHHLERWHKDENFISVARHIKISDKPDVFQHFLDDDNDIAIWRTALPENVILFVNTALETLGGHAAKKLSDLWESLGTQTLNQQDHLMAQGLTISADCITATYAQAGMDADLVQPFADFFLSSVRQVLLNLPKRTTLNSTTITRNCFYNPREEMYVDMHPDAWPTLIFNFSDPGAAYPLGKNSEVYRTQIGDFVIHGGDVLHGFATAKPSRDSKPRPRFFSSFGLGTV